MSQNKRERLSEDKIQEEINKLERWTLKEGSFQKLSTSRILCRRLVS